MVYLISALIIAAFVGIFLWDRRSLLGAFMFLLSLGAIYISVVEFSYNRGSAFHDVLLVGIYGLFPLALLALAVFMIANGVEVRRKERKSLGNSLSLIFGSGIIAYSIAFVLFIWKGEMLRTVSVGLWRAVTYAFLLASFVFAICMFIFLAYAAYSILYANLPRKRDYDYVVVHGAGLRGKDVTPLLASRIDTAIEALRAGTTPDVKLIASGGQGPDEEISEAAAIAHYAEGHGVDADRILLEDRSATTWQNLRMSKDVAVADSGNPDPQFLFVTSNYHVMRTSFYARKLGLRGDGLGARTAGYYVPTAFLREYVAILVKFKWVLIGMTGAFGLFLFTTL